MDFGVLGPTEFNSLTYKYKVYLPSLRSASVPTLIKPDWIQESGQRWTVAQKWIDTRLKMDGTKTLKKTVINDRVNRSPMRNVVWTLELDSLPSTFNVLMVEINTKRSFTLTQDRPL